MELNTLRNKCSHNWLLKVPVRRGKRPRRRAAEQRDERAALHSITSSASASSLYGQVHGLFTLENATRVMSNLPVLLYQAHSVTDEPARHHELGKLVHGWNRMACHESNDVLNPAVEEDITTDEQRPGSCLDQAHEGGVDFAVGACFQYLNL